MKRALLISTVGGFVPQFEMNNVKILKCLGYEIHYASNFKNMFYKNGTQKLEDSQIVCHQVDFERSPYRLVGNLRAYRQLKELANRMEFKLVHCHTPMGGALGRLALRGNGRRIYYTAHGFHFYKGAPLTNWLLYYPVERLLSRWTDVLITINREDYERAKRFHAKRAVYIPGIGIDLHKYHSACIDKKEMRKRLGVSEGEKLVLSVGELNRNKNHIVVIKALANLNDGNVRYVICGEGVLKEKLIREAARRHVKLDCLGYRTDILEIYQAADIYALPSKREGLSVSLMEAMASGLPVLCSKIRGNEDLVKNNVNGIFCKSVEDYEKAVKRLLSEPKLCNKYTANNLKTIKNFDIKSVETIMKKEYVNTSNASE